MIRVNRSDRAFRAYDGFPYPFRILSLFGPWCRALRKHARHGIMALDLCTHARHVGLWCNW